MQVLPPSARSGTGTRAAGTQVHGGDRVQQYRRQSARKRESEESRRPTEASSLSGSGPASAET